MHFSILLIYCILLQQKLNIEETHKTVFPQNKNTIDELFYFPEFCLLSPNTILKQLKKNLKCMLAYNA